MLRLYHAFQAYNSRYGVTVLPNQALDLLATDPQLPDSLSRSVAIVAEELGAISAGPNSHYTGVARRLAGRLGALIHYEWPDREDQEELLREVREQCRMLHDFVTATYFEYSIEDTPVR